MTTLLLWLLCGFSLLISAQAAYTVYLMLYTWNEGQAFEDARAPRVFRPPTLSFTALLPARHEEAVIGRTLERVMQTHYPPGMLEAIVICEAGDSGTIAAAQQTIDRLRAEGITGARVVTFSDLPINKPHGLNKGLAQARGDIVTVFDAEDDMHPDIFNVINTVMVEESVRVVQSGVQLMNYDSSWFAAHNVLEYYFWFKSRLHFYARSGITPLGGNTVFFDTALLHELGGWDETNLTEDAEIGIRLSAQNERVRVIYDDEFVTKEETPPNLRGFIRQRTRWNQGFLQTLQKGVWQTMPRRANRLRALHILSFPFVQAVQALYVPISLAMLVLLKLPVLVAIILFVPGYLLFAHYLLTVVGLNSFARAHGLRLRRHGPLLLLVTYFPYLCVLGYAAGRALWRERLGLTNWEKTVHTGAHRQPLAEVLAVAYPIAAGSYHPETTD